VNPHLASLQPYPFERLNALKAGVHPSSNAPHIALSIGEPKHAPPPFLVEALRDQQRLVTGLGGYPATRGSDGLRAAIATWLGRRFHLGTTGIDPATQILPVAGTREALFSFGQTITRSMKVPRCCAAPDRGSCPVRRVRAFCLTWSPFRSRPGAPASSSTSAHPATLAAQSFPSNSSSH